MKSETDIMAPTQPSSLERLSYYHGVGGKLLARTSNFEFRGTITGDMGSIQFTTIGQHGIVSIWSREVTICLQEALEEVHWERFYPIRTKVNWPYEFDDLNDSRNAVVLIIEVPCGKVNWNDAAAAAWRCRIALRRFNILDVEVEVREIDRQPYAMDADLQRCVYQQDWALHDLPFTDHVNVSYETFLPALSHIGYEITPEFESPSRYGTMGLHVRLSDRPSEAYGFTCRHVAHRPMSESDRNKEALWATDEDEYHLEPDASEKHRIIQMCPSSLENLRFYVRQEIKNAEKTLRDLNLVEAKHISAPTTFPELSEDESYLRSRLRKGTQVLGNIEAALLNDRLKEDDARAIGHVAFMPPFEVSRTSGFLRDWALIRLDKAKFKEDDEIVNQIFVSRRDINDLNNAARKHEALMDMKAFIEAKRDRKGMIRLCGGLSGASPFHSGDPNAMGVGKRGASSRLTFGATNEIKAVVRRCKDNRLVTWEWIVVGADASTPFAKAGDSGAVLFNSEGRVIGVISAGCPDGRAGHGFSEKCSAGKMPADLGEDAGAAEKPSVAGFRHSRPNVDVSFATPVDVVFSDIRHVTGSDVEVI
ncbi:hypothetical protein F4861DRAFT_277722 [Xylaria intraflava]|nr:hypothetical protein F4861DRAFT_277722 [Xylaria intraflava]